MFITVDIGGTNTRVASSKDLKSIHKVERFKSDKDVSVEKHLIQQAISLVSEGQKVEAVSFGVPGTVDSKKRVFVKFPNYKTLEGKPFDSLLDVKATTFVQNDAMLAGLAESYIGAGKAYDTCAYLTLSTGVGGAFIDKNQKDIPEVGYEPGHQIIDPNGRYNDRCGQFGCLESYCSGTSFEEMYRMKPEDCNDEIVWDDYAKHLSTGLINLLSLWHPDCFVLGGKVSTKFPQFYPKLVVHLKNQRYFPVPPIFESEFKDDSGLYGGFLYLKLKS